MKNQTVVSYSGIETQEHQNGKKAAIAIVSDNFSRAILGCLSMWAGGQMITHTRGTRTRARTWGVTYWTNLQIK